MTRCGFRKNRKGMAPPSYLPRVQARTRSYSVRSDRRFASSLQCEHAGLMSVGYASGLETRTASTAQALAASSAAARAARQRGRMETSLEESGVGRGVRLALYWTTSTARRAVRPAAIRESHR